MILSGLGGEILETDSNSLALTVPLTSLFLNFVGVITFGAYLHISDYSQNKIYRDHNELTKMNNHPFRDHHFPNVSSIFGSRK